MELILLQDVQSVGSKGDVVRVSEGFARNFLLPRRFAIASTRSNRQFVEEQRARMVKKRAQQKTEAENKAQQLQQMKLTMEAAAGEQDKLFGSITAEDIRQALAERGYAVDRKRIHLQDPIRALGSHVVSVELYPQVKASVTVEVIRKS